MIMFTNTRKPKNSQLTTIYDISGEGVRRVVQESAQSQTDVVFVYDKDIHGKLIRIGYCFTSRATEKQISPIMWFSKDEVNIFSKKTNEECSQSGRLEVKFNHPKNNEKHFNITLPFGDKSVLFRFIFKVEKDGTENFVVVVQSKNFIHSEGRWIASVRYDCAHGFVHKDYLSANGRRVRKKEELPIQDKKQAVSFIVDNLLRDIKTKIGLKKQSILMRDIDGDMLKAEKTLLKLFKSKRVFERFESTSVMYSEAFGSIG